MRALIIAAALVAGTANAGQIIYKGGNTMQYMILILTLVFSASALGENCHYRSVRIGGDMIAVGDSPRKAHEAEPDREVPLENRYGGAAGYRLDFYERGKTVEIHINRGEVTRICQRSD